MSRSANTPSPRRCPWIALAVLGALVGCFAAPVVLADGGTLRGTVTYKGEPPSEEPLEVDHDMDCCAKKPILPETLLLEDGKVKDAVIWIEGVKGDKPWPLDAGVMDQQGCIFLPHIVVIGVGETMRFLNSDPIIHNIHTWPRNNPPMSVSQLAKGLGRPIKRSFDLVDEIKVTCDVHKWMSAWILVRDNAYYSQSGEDGAFEITEIPPGKYKVVFWHESLERIEKEIEFTANTSYLEDVVMTLK